MVFVFSLFSITSTAVIQGYDVKISIGRVNASPGSIVDVPVNIEGIIPNGIDCMQIKIKYDKNTLVVSEVTPGSIIINPANFAYSVDSVLGEIRILFSDQSCYNQYINSTGLFANIKFTVNSTAQSGPYFLTMDYMYNYLADLSKVQMPYDVQEGCIRVEEAAPSSMIMSESYSVESAVKTAPQTYSLSKLNDFNVNIGYDDATMIKAKRNIDDIQKKFKLDKKMIFDKKSTSLSLKLKNLDKIPDEGYTPFEGKGTITVSNTIHTIKVNGQLERVKTTDGAAVLVGVLSGYLNDIQDDEKLVTLTIHYIPEQGECSVFASIGVAYNNNIPAIMYFGNQFIEMKDAVDKIVSRAKVYDTQNVTSFSSNASSLMETRTGPPHDNDPQLRSAASACGNSIYTNLYVQKVTEEQKPVNIAGKIAVNFANAEKYIEQEIDGTILTSFEQSINNVSIQFRSKDSSFVYLSGEYPESFTQNVNFSIMAYIPYLSLGWQTIQISYIVSSVAISYSDINGNSSGTRTNIKWDMSKTQPTFGTDTAPGPINTRYASAVDLTRSTEGVGVNCFYTYKGSVINPKDVPIMMDGIADFKYKNISYWGYGTHKLKVIDMTTITVVDQMPAQIIKYGDLNSDGNVNAGDYTILRRYLLNIITVFPAGTDGLIAADVSGDGLVNAGDYTLLRRYILRIIDNFPVES